MPQVWMPDDLRFADLRAAHFEPAEQVAADLLAAAGQPASRLVGVTAAEASLRAAELLIAQDRDRAASIAEQVLQDVRGSSEELAAACMLARAGHEDAVEALAAPALSALRDRPSHVVIFDAANLAMYLADGGAFELAARVAHEAAAVYARWKNGPDRCADSDGALGNMVELTRQVVVGVHQDLQDLVTGQRAEEPGMQPSMLLPWPALFGSCLLWWPEAEYQRIVRQVPDVRSVLGVTWRDHTVKVESAMLALVPVRPVPPYGEATAYSLVAAEFEYFCGYLRLTGADPRLASTMTGFTARLIGLVGISARGIRQPVRWPPAERSRCWCGSNARYKRCCRLHGWPPSVETETGWHRPPSGNRL